MQVTVLTSQNQPPWHAIDTVLLDMDGTLLDLCYDNHIWNVRLPELYAAKDQPEPGPVTVDAIDRARQQLFAHMHTVKGTIDYYDIDYWASYSGVNMLALHRAHSDLIRYRPSAQRFLAWLGATGCERVLATNAHRDSVEIKDHHAQLLAQLDSHYSAHDFGHPKEQSQFWEQLQASTGFDPLRTLFIDDNQAVLESAERFGIAHLRMVSQPDSGQPAREALSYPAFNDFAELMPQPVAS